MTLSPSEAAGTWFTDRYVPAVFESAPAFQGRDGVVRVGVSHADSQEHRTSPYSAAFYNTQGRKYDAGGGDGSYIEFSLYIPQSWSDPANVFANTSMWTTVVDDLNAISAYPIIGFTNFGAAGARLRVWDSNIGYVNLATALNYDEWTALRLSVSGSNIEYSVNGANVYTANTGSPASFRDVMLQVYNFGAAFDPGNTLGNTSMGMANNPSGYSYDAYWQSSAATPEPGTWTLALAGLGAAAWFKRRNLAKRP
ncbi:MAG: PEP-CTERM sorting domain-containing protein [Bryobacteraceae bacterium]|nr:PEP-CTERM sorting domain-containing protein [Bryobacteraceae bacterium]